MLLFYVQARHFSVLVDGFSQRWILTRRRRILQTSCSRFMIYTQKRLFSRIWEALQEVQMQNKYQSYHQKPRKRYLKPEKVRVWGQRSHRRVFLTLSHRLPTRKRRQKVLRTTKRQGVLFHRHCQHMPPKCNITLHKICNLHLDRHQVPQICNITWNNVWDLFGMSQKSLNLARQNILVKTTRFVGTSNGMVLLR